LLEVGIGVAVFTTIVTALVLLILAAGAWLAPSGEVAIRVNDDRLLAGPAGAKLLSALADKDIHLPSACGGRGTCGQCAITVEQGVDPPLAVESSVLRRAELARGARLACQLTLRHDLAVRVPAEILGVRKLLCTVRSGRSVATLMRELVIDLPAGEEIDFRAGAYIQVTCPPYRAAFSGFDIGPEYRAEWQRLDLWRHEVESVKETTRAYSIASAPIEKQSLRLLIRIATPPPGAPDSVPPGIVSSYLFGLKPGDDVEIAGPYGTFLVADTDREMIFVGGGAGMAPMRSMILDQLDRVRTARKISFWYGARNLRELFYEEDFDRLQAEHENFHWTVALSEPAAEDHWRGETGFVHEVLDRCYLANHPAPAACEYYLCGPPMMIKAVLGLLARLGVDRDSVRFDDFGT